MEQDVFDIRKFDEYKEDNRRDMGKLVDDGATKGKRYQLKCMDGTN